jgi:hypothetical protein
MVGVALLTSNDARAHFLLDGYLTRQLRYCFSGGGSPTAQALEQPGITGRERTLDTAGGKSRYGVTADC